MKPPPHALSKKRIKELLNIVPSEWTASFKIIHFSSQMPQSSAFDRPVILSTLEKRLNILSRGISEIEIVEEILIELVQNLPRTEPHKPNLLKAHWGNHLDKKQLKVIKKIINPYLEKYKQTGRVS